MISPSEKIVIYTAVVAGKDRLSTPQHKIPGAHYVCFTDTPELCSTAFEHRPLPFREISPSLTARRIKLFAHTLFPEHETSLWIDGSKHIIGDITPLLHEALDKHNMACFSHPHRHCIYDEIDACIKLGRASRTSLQVQKEYYLAQGIPRQLGLFSTNVLLRRHHAQDVRDTMELWWQHLQQFSERDQVSLPVVLRELTAQIHTLAYIPIHNQYFVHKQHLWHPPGDSRNGWRPRIRRLINKNIPPQLTSLYHSCLKILKRS